MATVEKNNWLTESIVIAMVKQTLQDRNPSEQFEFDPEANGFLSRDRTMSIYPKGTPIPEWKGEKDAEEFSTYAFSLDKIHKALKFLRDSIRIISSIPFTPLVIEDNLFQIRIAPLTG